MLIGLWIVLAVVLASSVGALVRWLRDGRVRGVGATSVGAPARPRLGAADLGAALGERATLVQFSTSFCQPCRAARAVLGSVAGQLSGVRHVEIDAESHLDLVRRLGITRTPTTLVLDREGTVRGRAGGVPRRDDVVASLQAVGAA